MSDRLPRTNAHQKEQPESTGKHWFQGVSIRVTNGVETRTRVQNRPFEVALADGVLVPTNADTGELHEGSELIGTWTRDEDMGGN